MRALLLILAAAVTLAAAGCASSASLDTPVADAGVSTSVR